MSPATAQRTRDLTRRLAEAEATIEALLSGQIDAVVDSTSRTPVLLAKAQGALRESEQRYHTERDRAQRYLDTAQVILLALDLEGRITLVNRHACLVLGWTEEELLGRNFIETCVPAAMRQDAMTRLRGVLSGPDSSVVHSRIVTKSGKERIIEWRIMLQRDEQGQVLGTLSSGTDITDRDQAVEALQAAEERMRFALEASGIGIWDVDYTTGAVRWSAILEAQYGLKPGTFGGTFAEFAECIHPDDRASILGIIDSAAKSGADFSFEHRCVWADGTVRWLSGAGRIQLGPDGTPLRGSGISQDITERHSLAGLYQQSQKMEAVGRLAGGIAHDFNNILSVILTCGEFLLQDLKPLDPARADAEEICKAGKRAAALTTQLLMFSRQQVLAPKVLELAALTTSMEGMLRRVIGEDVELTLLHDEQRGRIRADPGSIEQVIMNLVVNARDVMPTGGRLTIETQTEMLDENFVGLKQAGGRPGRHVVLCVSDTGTGMDQATQARIFEPFFTTKAVGEGTGLGLSTVFGIVQQSHGVIRVRSEVGKGTTFSIYLPQVEAEADTTRAKPPAVATRGTETILLVEDEDQVRAVARTILQRQGYRVIEMRSPAEALLYCQSRPEPIQLLLTDVVMPQMSGPELARRVADLLPNARVLFMTGYTDDSAVRHGVLQSDIAFLQKPLTFDSLTRKVREVLDADA